MFRLYPSIIEEKSIKGLLVETDFSIFRSPRFHDLSVILRKAFSVMDAELFVASSEIEEGDVEKAFAANIRNNPAAFYDFELVILSENQFKLWEPHLMAKYHPAFLFGSVILERHDFRSDRADAYEDNFRPPNG
jgi:hypothetical protein